MNNRDASPFAASHIKTPPFDRSRVPRCFILFFLVSAALLTVALSLHSRTPQPPLPPQKTLADESAQQETYENKLRSLIKQTIPQITVSQLKEQLSSPTPPVLLDSREMEEYFVSHLQNARHVGFLNFNPNDLATLPRQTPIVVYCSLGVRSELIGEKLKKAGFTNVKNLLGGLFEWVNRDMPVYDQEERPTPMVHAFSKKWGKWLKKGKKVYK